MADKIQAKQKISSTYITKEFLEQLEKIIDDNKEDKLEIEIVVKSNTHELTFGNTKNFVESRILPKNIKSIYIIKSPKLVFKNSLTKKKEAQEEQKKKNLLEFSLNLSDEEDSYYTLIGYDDGLISTAKKQINNLFDEYKTLYFWLFKIPLPKGTIQPIAGISAFFLIRNIVPPFIFNGIDWTSMAGLGIGGVTWLLSNKAYNFFFPFSDFQINRPRKNIILKSSVGLILVGLIVNLIWEIIKLLF